MQDFSVNMSVYAKDNSSFVSKALDSVLYQTVKPSEIVLVIDGPIPKDLNQIVTDYVSKYPIIHPIFLPNNKGLGNALNVALNHSKYELIARMDSDDIALPNRFEKQLFFLEKHPEVSLIGANITEFIDNPSNVVGRRICPTDDIDIKRYMKSRCPFNHMTVMFKKTDVLRAGNYQDWFWNEDYYLWIRMLLTGCTFANIPEFLVNVRVGKDMYARRGGLKYFRSESKLQYYMFMNRVISLPRCLYNILIRLILQVLMPNSLRGWFFRKFARQ